MILNLNNLLAQIQRMIFDPDALVWSVEQITDFIRLGLEDLQTISPVKCSLEGLDDAQTTSLESGMLAYLVRSIIARAYETRLLNRSETFHPDAQNGNTNRIWLDAEKEQLRQILEKLRLTFLQRSLEVPYQTWEEAPQATEFFVEGEA